jgi:hypothetical protein
MVKVEGEVEGICDTSEFDLNFITEKIRLDLMQNRVLIRVV